MVAYLERMPSGIPGDVTRRGNSKLEPVYLAVSTPYGTPLMLDASGEAVPATDVAKIHGWLARAYPTQSQTVAEHFGAGNAPAKTMQDSMRSGYISVRISSAEATKPVNGTPVKLVTAAANGFAAGDLAVSEGGVIPGCTFLTEPDASGNVEIAFNI